MCRMLKLAIVLFSTQQFQSHITLQLFILPVCNLRKQFVLVNFNILFGSVLRKVYGLHVIITSKDVDNVTLRFLVSTLSKINPL